MDVAISELRAHLADWVGRARDGENVVVTERGIPVARLVAVDSAGMIERLEREGILSKPASSRRIQARGRRRVRAKGSVSDLVRPKPDTA